MVHLSDLRLHPLHFRRHREHHPFAMHAGIRGPSPALRLDPAQPRHRVPARGQRPARFGRRLRIAGADRVRPVADQLHHDGQALPPGDGG